MLNFYELSLFAKKRKNIYRVNLFISCLLYLSVEICLFLNDGTLTFLCSMSRASHMEATIFETSPKLAFGFCPLIAA